LAARIKTVLRRTRPSESFTGTKIIRADRLLIDLERAEVRVDGRELTLTPSEFKILSLLAQNPGRVFTRSQILDAVSGDPYDGYERSIDTHISNLRRKIEREPGEPEFILTVYGLGYKFLDYTRVR
jgi:two-component system OmpR family response regulator